MKYITSKQLSEKWHLTERTIRNYCANGKIKGCYMNGKTWMIPENVKKIGSSNAFNGELVSGLVEYLDNSTVNYMAIENAKKLLEEAGYKELEENKLFEIKIGDKFFVTRNGTSILAFNIGNKIKNNQLSFHIVASHSDSPCFKIKPICDGRTDKYNKVNVEPYGGMIAPTWLDRPLGVAGRVLVKNDSKISTKIINIDEDILMIPNMCVHFNRDINDGHKYDMASDMQPFYGCELEEKPFINYLASLLNVDKENIVNFDLSLFNRQKATIWGEKSDYISSARLDDLEGVYTSLKAFCDTGNESAINVLYVADNEEVGSSSRQGADGDFLDVMLQRVAFKLGYTQDELYSGIANSFLISADNAHAVHPNFPGVTDNENKCYMNKGIAIKFNCSQRYTSDAISSSIFQEICRSEDVPYQFFTNRSDKRGGSTLGNILINHVSLLSVDIGLPQLAMHSAYETAGTLDVDYAYKAFKKFYQTNIMINGDEYEIK